MGEHPPADSGAPRCILCIAWRTFKHAGRRFSGLRTMTIASVVLGAKVRQSRPASMLRSCFLDEIRGARTSRAGGGLPALCPRAKARPILALQRAKQFRQRHAQPVREPAYDIETRCSLAALDTTYVGPVQTCPLGKFLLREFAIASELADATAKGQPEVFHEPEA